MTPDLEKGRRFLAAQGAPGALLVGVTGAHYYGFPSPDSDLDLKGIHAAPTREVVALAPPPDSADHLAIFEGLEIDYTSHELAVALRLLQLLESPDVTELQSLARASVSKKFFHHYRGFFARMCQDWRKADHGFYRVPDLASRKRNSTEKGVMPRQPNSTRTSIAWRSYFRKRTTVRRCLPRPRTRTR